MNRNILLTNAEAGNSQSTTVLTNRLHFPSNDVFQNVSGVCFCRVKIGKDACPDEKLSSGDDLRRKLELSTCLDIENSHHDQSDGQRIFFPQKLHSLLQEMKFSGRESIVSWQPHGLSFRVHDRKEFEKNILPLYFHHSNIASFFRQLNLYSFRRINFGIDKDAYYNDMFLRDQPRRFHEMETKRIKKNGEGKRYNTYQDPNFCDYVHLNSKGKSMRVKDDSVVSQAYDLRSEKWWDTNVCEPREDLSESDHQLTLPNAFSFENNVTEPFSMANRSEHNYLCNYNFDFASFMGARFMNLSELLVDEIEKEPLKENVAGISSSYVEADALCADCTQLSYFSFSDSES